MRPLGNVSDEDVTAPAPFEAAVPHGSASNDQLRRLRRRDHRLLHQPVEEQAATLRVPPVKAKDELV
jgi:hypothetical protein